MSIDTIIGIILVIVSIALLCKMCKGRSCDYKTRIRVYCAINKGEIFFVDTKRPEVEKYINMICNDYETGYDKKDFEIKIKYMSKLTYSLMREL